MRFKRVGTLAAIGFVACGTAVAVGQSGPDKSADLKASIDINKPKNIILFVGDGMGEQEVTSGRYYGKGATGRLAMDALKLRGDVTTYNVGPAAQAPYPPNYVPDSAPTASAWSSGIKTLDGRLGQGPSSGVTVPGTNFTTYMEIARDRGQATGNVSTAEITDATPGRSFLAHLAARLPGPQRHALHVPAGDQGRRRPRLDRRAAGRRALRRRPRRRPRPLRAAARGRWHQERHRLRDPGPRLQVRRHRGRDERRHVARPRPAPARPVPRQQHDDRVQPADRLGRRRRFHDDQVHPGQPRHRADAEGDDREGHLAAAGQPEGLRAPGRGRLDRQARPLRRRLRPDR